MRKLGSILLCTVILLNLMAACSTKVDEQEDDLGQLQMEDNEEPVTLTIATFLPFELFLKQIQAPLKEIYPNITLTHRQLSDPDQSLEAMIKEGNAPDIIMDIDWVFTPVHLLDQLRYDLSDYIKSTKLDLGQFDPGILDHIRAYGNNGEIYALPYLRYMSALFYNKDVFDKLQVDYPQDDMTWEQVIDLGKKLSVESDGVKYRGLDPMGGFLGIAPLIDQKSLIFVDPETEQSAVLNSSWRQMAELWKSIYDIPGNRPDAQSFFNQKAFMVDGTVAMALSEDISVLANGIKAGNNIDVVTYPSLKDAPGIAPGSRAVIASITKTSEHKDEAFKVIAYLVSEEAQTSNSKLGFGTTLSNPDVLQVFGEDLPETKGKNVQALFKHNTSSIPHLSKFEPAAYLVISDFFYEIAFGTKDIDTALKEMDQKINDTIVAQKAKIQTAESAK